MMSARDPQAEAELEILLRERTELKNTHRLLVDRAKVTLIQLRSVERRIKKLRAQCALKRPR
jgi:hypothetical protein